MTDTATDTASTIDATDASAASLSADAQAIALACIHLGGQSASGDAKPFSAGEWADLAARIHRSPFGRPGALFEADVAALQEALSLPAADAGRLYLRLRLGGHLAVEVERLASVGIRILT